MNFYTWIYIVIKVNMYSNTTHTTNISTWFVVDMPPSDKRSIELYVSFACMKACVIRIIYKRTHLSVGGTYVCVSCYNHTCKLNLNSFTISFKQSIIIPDCTMVITCLTYRTFVLSYILTLHYFTFI